MAARRIVQNLQVIFVAMIGFSAQAAQAATTLITFDEFPIGTEITTQYQNLGVTAAGVGVSGSFAFPNHSSPNIGCSSNASGVMSFALDSNITGPIKSVSAYISSSDSIGIYAYDSLGVLIGNAVLPAGSSVNTLLTFNSSLAPIASVSIHDGGGNFCIDDLAFSSDVIAPSCGQKSKDLYDAVVALPASAFKFDPEHMEKSDDHRVGKSSVEKRMAKLKKEVAEFQALLPTNVSDKRLRNELLEIKSDVLDWIKPSPARNNLFNQIDQILAMIKAGQC